MWHVSHGEDKVRIYRMLSHVVQERWMNYKRRMKGMDSMDDLNGIQRIDIYIDIGPLYFN